MSLYFLIEDSLSASFRVHRTPLHAALTRLLSFCEWRVSSIKSTTPNSASSATLACTSLSKLSAQIACTLSEHVKNNEIYLIQIYLTQNVVETQAFKAASCDVIICSSKVLPHDACSQLLLNGYSPG